MSREARKMPGRLVAILRYGVCGCAVLFVVVVVAVSLLRIPYPFEVEWLEGESLIQVQRILDGQGLYVEPSFAYVPGPYTPLFFYLSAAVSLIVGRGLCALRIVSFAASLGTLGLLFAMVRKRSGRLDAAFIAAGLYAATYRLSGSWFDVARTDALFLFLFVAASYLLATRSSTRSAVLAGALIGLSFLAKQTLLVMAAPAMAWLFVERWRRGLVVAGTAAAVIVGTSAVENLLTGGWYWYYVVTLPSRHGLFSDLELWFNLRFWYEDILRPLPVVCALAVGWAAICLGQGWQRGSLFELALAVGTLGVSWVGRVNSGFSNVLLPAYAGLALLVGLAVGWLVEQHATRKTQWSSVAAVVVLLLLAAQLLALRFDPRACLPTEADLRAGRELVSWLKSLPGEVVVSGHPYLLALAGKPTHAHQATLMTQIGGFGGKPDRYARRLLDDLARDVANHRYSAIILDGPKKPGAATWFVPLEGHYRLAGRFFTDPKVFMSLTGAVRQPRDIWVPAG